MQRKLFILVLAVAPLAGCSRSDTSSPEPRDWRIGADDGYELQQWFDDNLPLMSEDLGRELTVCVANIQTSNYAGPNPEPMAKVNKLAKHLDGRTVRELLIEGNEAGVRVMESRVKSAADTLVKMISTTDGTNAREQKYIEYQRAVVDGLKKQLTKAQDHLLEIHNSGLKQEK